MNKTQPTFLYNNNLQLILFGGESRAGKTTCALSASINLAQKNPEKEFLLVAIDPSPLLINRLFSIEIPNLKIIELNSSKKLDKFKDIHNQILQKITSKDTFLYEDNINQFIDFTMPGFGNLLTFLEIAKWYEEKKYNCIIVDKAPDYNGLKLIPMPGLLTKWVDALDTLLTRQRLIKQVSPHTAHYDELDIFLKELSRILTVMQAVFQNPEVCNFVPVMLPEAPLLAKTADLISRLEESKISVTDIVINKLYTQGVCSICSESYSRQGEEVKNLLMKSHITPYTLWGIPLQEGEAYAPTLLRNFWNNLTEIFSPKPQEQTQPAAIGFTVENAAECIFPETKLILFSGKEGGKKTTIACAAAIKSAQEWKNKKILLFSTDSTYPLAKCLGVEVGTAPTVISEGLSAMEIDMAGEFGMFRAEYSRELNDFFHSIPAHLDLSYDREVMQRLLDFTPSGIDEMLAVSPVLELMSAGKYDLFIFNAANGAHIVHLLDYPLLISQWIKVFFEIFLKYKEIFRLKKVSQRLIDIPKNIKLLHHLLSSPDLSRFYPITIVSHADLEELKKTIIDCNHLGIAVPDLFMVLSSQPGDCPTCSNIYQQELQTIAVIKQEPYFKRQTIIYFPEKFSGLEQLGKLGDNLFLPCKTAKTTQQEAAKGEQAGMGI